MAGHLFHSARNSRSDAHLFDRYIVAGYCPSNSGYRGRSRLDRVGVGALVRKKRDGRASETRDVSRSALRLHQSIFKTQGGLTKRAVDLWDSAAFSSIFLASGFSCSQAFSQPAHKPLTQTVGRLFINGRYRDISSWKYWQTQKTDTKTGRIGEILGNHMSNCVNCGQPTNGKTFRLFRFNAHHIPFMPIAIIHTANGMVPLCDNCDLYFKQANLYRIGGLIIFLGVVFLTGVTLILTSSLYSCFVLALAPAGIAFVIKGRSRLHALERKVGF